VPHPHHWSRELQALDHRERLMPPAYVKRYIKRQKNDAAPHLLSVNPGAQSLKWP
jgi:transposase